MEHRHERLGLEARSSQIELPECCAPTEKVQQRPVTAAVECDAVSASGLVLWRGGPHITWCGAGFGCIGQSRDVWPREAVARESEALKGATRRAIQKGVGDLSHRTLRAIEWLGGSVVETSRMRVRVCV